jgi:plasmid maintenance system killer protein
MKNKVILNKDLICKTKAAQNNLAWAKKLAIFNSQREEIENVEIENDKRYSFFWDERYRLILNYKNGKKVVMCS